MVVLVLPAAELGGIDAAALGRAEAAELLAAPADALTLLPAPTALDEGLVVVEVDVPLIEAVPRISMNTTMSPLLAELRKVPAMEGMLLDEAVADGEDVLEVEVDVEPALAPLEDVNEPVHWFCVSSCW